MSYADFFNTPNNTRGVTTASIFNPSGTVVGNDIRTTVLKPERAGGLKSGSSIDKIMAGYDAESKALTQKLKGIYDSYQGYISDYEGDIQPIIEALNGDIEKMGGYLDTYQGTLDEMRPTFMSGIEVEPNAAGRRSEYMGGVASQYDSAEEAMNRDMASQGMNPYANKGASRDFKLQRGAAMAGASNQAYSDWRAQHNQDVQAKQAGMATYAGLESKVPEIYSGVMGARAGVAGMYRDVLDTRLNAQKSKASGYEGILGLTENRRSEALGLEANKAIRTAAGRNPAQDAQTVALSAHSAAANNPLNPYNR